MSMKSTLHHNIVAIISLCFALTGFSYNAWRMEQSEENNNIRTASFQVLLELSELEQVIFHAHYDHDSNAGNPRTGWVKVGLSRDLSVFLTVAVQQQIKQLAIVWEATWPSLGKQDADIQVLLQALKKTRQLVISDLEAIQ